MNSYWNSRAEQNEKHSLSLENNLLKEQKAQYKKVLSKIDDEVNKLYMQMLRDGGISTTNLYSFGRYANMRNLIFDECGKISTQQTNEIYKTLKQVYKETFSKTFIEKGAVKWGVMEEHLMKECLISDWSGKNFSERVWENSDLLAKRLDKTLRETIALGEDFRKVKKGLSNEFNVAYSRASTLVRTESMFTMNQAAADRYTQEGVTEYEFLASIDDRTSDECADLNGQVFNFSEMQIGVNYPPIHPNCRSTVIPLIK